MTTAPATTVERFLTITGELNALAAAKPVVAKPEPRTGTTNWTNRPDLRAKHAEWRRLKAIEKAGKDAEAARKDIEAEMVEAMGDAAEVIVRGVSLLKHSSVRTTHKYDTKALAQAFPEAYDAIHSETYYTYLQ